MTADTKMTWSTTIFLIASMSCLGLCDGQKNCYDDDIMIPHNDRYIIGPMCYSVSKCYNGYLQSPIDHFCPRNSTCNNKKCVCNSPHTAPRWRDGLLNACERRQGCRQGSKMIPHNEQYIYNNCSTMSICNNGEALATKSYSCPEGTTCDDSGSRCVEEVTDSPPQMVATTEVQKVASTEVQKVASTEPPMKCADGYSHYEAGLTCIKAVSNMRVTWHQARKHCQKDGGDLVQIFGPGLNNFVKGLLTRRLRYWTGISADYGVFKYLSGITMADYHPWAHKEPNNKGGNEWCMEIIGNNKGSWNDKRCSRRRPFVCQMASYVADSCSEGDFKFKHGEVWLYGNCQKATRCNNGYFTPSVDFTCPSNTACVDDKCLPY